LLELNKSMLLATLVDGKVANRHWPEITAKLLDAGFGHCIGQVGDMDRSFKPLRFCHRWASPCGGLTLGAAPRSSLTVTFSKCKQCTFIKCIGINTSSSHKAHSDIHWAQSLTSAA